jgi:hypothetical protein
LRERVTAQGRASYWVVLQTGADLQPAYAISDWTLRGQFVVDRLQAVATSSQARLRAHLTARGTSFEPFWAVNALRVAGTVADLDDLAAQPEVAEVLEDRVYLIPTPEPGAAEAAVNAVEWNIDAIRATGVWSSFEDRGDGIVVANIDTGVLHTHAALSRQYRGRQPDGTLNHNYNWFDPARVCGVPSLAPCDNQRHGSHTMGTMVGDDDPGPNHVGVAPHARWIAAKGCESTPTVPGCSSASLLASGQWVLAPTDLNGLNPMPGLRPHVVNNSWGSTNGSNVLYQAMVQAWVASGIFPSFSNGNNGAAGCRTVGSLASYPESYGVGAFSSSNTIASFSSRGAAPVALGVGAIRGRV